MRHSNTAVGTRGRHGFIPSERVRRPRGKAPRERDTVCVRIRQEPVQTNNAYVSVFHIKDLQQNSLAIVCLGTGNGYRLRMPGKECSRNTQYGRQP